MLNMAVNIKLYIIVLNHAKITKAFYCLNNLSNGTKNIKLLTVKIILLIPLNYILKSRAVVL